MSHTRTNPGITYEQQPGKLSGLSIHQHHRVKGQMSAVWELPETPPPPFIPVPIPCDPVLIVPPPVDPVAPSQVPESGASAAMMGLALLAVVVFRRIRK